MKRPILAVLAAGIGSRYGGLKQMDKIGKSGEVLLEYSVYDAIKAGFEKIVFIIRHDIEKDFREQILHRIDSKIKCELAFQDADSLIPPDIFAAAQKVGRTKPWGTGHALLCAAENLDAPFAIINADDFYGREAFVVMCNHLAGAGAEMSAIVPYCLEKTLSSQGTVARGVCKIDGGFLAGVDELTAIEKKDGRIINTSADGSIRELPADSAVSMNFWGFPPDILPQFKKYFNDFLENFASDAGKHIKEEFFIPKTVDCFITREKMKVKVLDANSEWFGVTYREDREAAAAKINELTLKGVYPASLWDSAL